MNKLENVEYYRNLKVVKKSLEYKLILELDEEKKKRIKVELLNLKLHIKILEQSLKVLSKKEEYEVIYLSFFKEGWEFKTVTEIAEHLYISVDSVYKHRIAGRKKIETFFKQINIEDREIIDIREKLENNRKHLKLVNPLKNQLNFLNII